MRMQGGQGKELSSQRRQCIRRPKGKMANDALKEAHEPRGKQVDHFKMKRQAQQGNGLIPNQVLVNDKA